MRTNQAATALSGPSLSPFQAKQHLCDLARHGVLAPVGKAGVGERASWLWTREAVLTAAVLFEAKARVGLSVAQLRILAALLMNTGPNGEPPLIEDAVEDIACGGEPMLGIMFWETPHGDEPSFHVRLTSQLGEPVAQPDDYEPVLAASLYLSRLLRRFVRSGANVVPLKAAD